jgi:hypothetical protein
MVKTTFLRIFLGIFVILSLLSLMATSKVPSNAMISNDYHISFNQSSLSMNLTLSMKQGEIIEYNISITNLNTSLTIVIEIHNPAGRLWGMFLEERTQYTIAKQNNVFSSFQLLVNHVSNYTVVHVNRTIGEYTLAFHNSHMHVEPEPETHFTCLIINGLHGSPINYGISTSPSATGHNHNAGGSSKSINYPVVESILLLAVIGRCLVVYRQNRQNNSFMHF